MKKINLIEWLSRNSHEKQSPQRFARYAAMLIMLLTLGVGQMWADAFIEAFGLQFYESSTNRYFKTGTDIKNSLAFGNKTSDFKIVYIYANGKKNGGNLCGDVYFKWWLEGTDGASNSGGVGYTSNNWDGDYCYWKFGTENGSTALNGIDLVQNRRPGDYTFKFYYSFKKGDCSQNQWDDCKYSGGDFKFTYTIPDPTITITGASSLVAGTSTNIQASISNYPVGSQITKVRVTGNLASAKETTGSATSLTVSSVTPNASGSNGITVTVTVKFGTGGTKDYVYNYNVLPPAVSDFTITPTGSLAGSGTEGNPYLVTYNGSITFSLSGADDSKAYADANSTAQYSTDGSSYGTASSNTSKTHSSVTQTTNQNWVYRAKLKNKSAALYGAIKEKTVYWKVPTYTVTLDKNGGTTGGSATATHGLNTLSFGSRPTKTGYDITGYYTNDVTPVLVADASGNLQASASYTDASSKWNSLSNQTLYTHWTAHTYTVTLNAGTGGSGSGTMTVDYDATGYKTFSHTIEKPGYTISGWYTAASEGTKVLNANGSFAGENVSDYITTNKWNKAANCTLYAHWTANTYTVTLDKQTSAEGHGENAGTVGDQTVTFDATPATVSGTMPSAADGYAFMGFYSEEGGNGRRFIDTSGNWVTDAGDTISGGNWVKPAGITLYAYYKKAEITALTLDNAVVAPGGEVGVTPRVAPTPTGTNSICWKLLYSNGNLYSPQPTFSPASPAGISNKVTFTAPPTSGTYLIAAVLRTGNECNGGTKLDSVTSAFQVAGDHTVTVQYKDAEGNTLQASGTVTGRPLVWTEVVAHDIFGYTFSGWTAGDGITLEDAESGRLAALQAEDPTIVAVTKMKAIYDGRLTANYTKKDFIYFKNTLGWSGDDIHVYFYTSSGYWNETKGAGASGGACIGKGKMELVPGETDIYYWDYGAGVAGGAANATNHVAFTDKNEMSQGDFWDCEVVYPTKGNNEGFSTGTPMFVPISQTSVGYNNSNGKQADYYNKGYWTKYAGGTGYSVDIFFSKGGSYDKSINFEEGETAGMPFTATAYLSGGTILGFKIHRSSGLYYYSSTDVTMSNASTAKSLAYDGTSNNQTGITTNVTGEYTFTLTCGSDGRLNVTVKYPAAAGDYRLVYSDGVQTKPLVSDVVPQVNGGKDTVSFFVRPGSTPVLKIQQASESAGVLSWGDYSIISSSVSGLEETGVYNICLQMEGSGAISVENVEAYTGEFYIRTDAANNKWDNYRAPDHLMTYSEYSETYSDYTHYFMAYVAKDKNVKFVVANDYSPCISDTLVQSTFRGGDSYHVDGSGNIKADANVRFMWNRSNNAVYRAYLDKAKSDGSRFLVLRANSNTDLMDENGNALLQASTSEQAGYNHGAPDNSIQFVDNENWIYETNVMVRPGAYVKLYAHFHDKDFYYRGNDNDYFNGTEVAGVPNAIQLITGGGAAVKVRVVYDFKTDRLLAAWMPEGEIDDRKAINADVMFVREGQGDIAQLTFTESGEISAIKTAYGVMKFNKWTLNNKEKTGSHTVLSSPASIYERSLFWISFPFRVKLSEVFGFGTYGVDWAIQRYDGAERAEKGFWAESSGFWKWMDRNTEYLEPNQGYLLAIDLDLLGESASVWNNGVENVELYFPSYGTMPSITSANVEHTLPSHACTIDWSGHSNGNGGTLGSAYNRTVIDSHWNVMSVPTYVNTSNVSFTNEEWIAEADGIHGPNFLYTWNMDDNTLTPTAGADYHYHAMHAYMVQYHGDVTWTASSGSPYSPIVARRTYAEQPKKVNFCLEIQQNEKMLDRTFVQLSDDEEVSAEFNFGEDMGKEFNSRKANIYTVIEGYLQAAGNTLPMSDQTTLVPVGVKTTAAGEYTFAMPDGTNGVSVVLIDNIAGTRTNLALSDYTVALGKGDLSDRFMLEIAPIKQMPTDIENVQGGDVQGAKARKVMVDGILYIVKDGKVFDARGAKVK